MKDSFKAVMLVLFAVASGLFAGCETDVESKPSVYYTVEFDSDGGSTVEPQKIEKGKTAAKPADPSKDGVIFTGWYKGNEEFDFSTPVIDNVALKAKWSVTIIFDSDGGSPVDSQTIESGLTAERPAAPSKDGYTFAGWYVGEEKFDFSTPIISAFTLKAKWSEIVIYYTVNFDSDGGTSVDSQIIESGLTAERPADPIKDGFTFGGWYAGNEEFDFSTPINKVLTLKAKWNEIIIYNTVNFNSNGGTSVDSQTIESGKTAVKPADPSKDGLTFAGWYKGNEEFDFSTPVTDDLNLKAKWSAKISFDSNGGSVVESQIVETGKLAIKPADPSKDGVTFVGWYMGNEEFDFSTHITCALTLKAKWSATITFDSNGGTSVNSQTFESGLTAVRPADPSKEGFTFEGWYAGDEKFDFSTSVTSALTLKAKWLINTTVSVTLESVNSQIPELMISESEGIFTATAGFTLYLWKIDGEVAKSGSDNTYTPDAETLSAGHHNILLFVTDSEGAFNSVTAVFTINK